jgi:nicotinate-nucleotide pyrophosphorylase
LQALQEHHKWGLDGKQGRLVRKQEGRISGAEWAENVLKELMQQENQEHTRLFHQYSKQILMRFITKLNFSVPGISFTA